MKSQMNGLVQYDGKIPLKEFVNKKSLFWFEELDGHSLKIVNELNMLNLIFIMPEDFNAFLQMQPNDETFTFDTMK